MRMIMALVLATGMLIPVVAQAAPCRDAKGHFIKCPTGPKKAAARCRDAKGHFVKCSGSGAKQA